MPPICSSASAIATCTSSTRRRRKTPFHLRRFSFSDLHSATAAFSPSTLLGKGCQSTVHLAVFPNLLAAVKLPTLPPPPTHRRQPPTGAANELHILSNLRGPLIVNLLGYAVDPTTSKLLLVLQHMPNGSLHDLLHQTAKPPGLPDRVRFALQTARSILFLHTSNPPVIHRDIKSSNVLIDGFGRARLCDFGLSLRGDVAELRQLAAPPAGTLGYLDPCYLAPGGVGPQNDVFSFGVLLLEIISCRRALDVNYSPASVVEWALPLIRDGRWEEICDRRIGWLGDRMVVGDLAALAARCVRSAAERRPAMGEVVECLGGVYRRVSSPVWRGLMNRAEKSRQSIRFDQGWTQDKKIVVHPQRLNRLEAT